MAFNLARSTKVVLTQFVGDLVALSYIAMQEIPDKFAQVEGATRSVPKARVLTWNAADGAISQGTTLVFGEVLQEQLAESGQNGDWAVGVLESHTTLSDDNDFTYYKLNADAPGISETDLEIALAAFAELIS